MEESTSSKRRRVQGHDASSPAAIVAGLSQPASAFLSTFSSLLQVQQRAHVTNALYELLVVLHLAQFMCIALPCGLCVMLPLFTTSSPMLSSSVVPSFLVVVLILLTIPREQVRLERVVHLVMHHLLAMPSSTSAPVDPRRRHQDTGDAGGWRPTQPLLPYVSW